MIEIKKFSHLIPEASWVLTGQLLTIIISLAGLRLLTELAPPEVLGEATLWLGIIALVRNFIVAPVGNTQIRFHPQYLARGLGEWFNSQIAVWLKYAILCAAVVFLIVFIIWSLIAGNLSVVLGLILLLYLLFDSVKSYKLNRVSAERKQKFVAIWISTEALLINGLFVLALLFVVSTESYLFGQAAGLVISLLIFGFAFYPEIKKDENMPAAGSDKELKSNIIKYGLPFIPLAVFGWISNLGDRYIIGSLLTVEQVGLYTAAYGIASRPFNMIPGIISAFFRPILFQAESEKRKEKGRQAFNVWLLIVFLIGLTGVLLFFFLGEFVAKLLLAEEYREQAPKLFVFVGSGYAFFALINVIENRLLSFAKSSSLLLPAGVCSVVNISANLFLIPEFGIVGAAGSTLLAFFFQFIVIVFIWLKYEKK